MNRSMEPEPASPNHDEVRLRLGIGAVRMEFRGRRAFFERHVAPLVEAAYAHGGLGSPEPEVPAGPVFQPSSPQQFSQFAAQVGARAASSEQRVMAFVFYFWNYEKREAVGAEDIGAFFRTVQEEPPEDLEPMLETLVSSRRFLARADDGKRVSLTPKGVNYVKNRLLAAM